MYILKRFPGVIRPGTLLLICFTQLAAVFAACAHLPDLSLTLTDRGRPIRLLQFARLSPLSRFAVVISPAAAGMFQQRLSGGHYRRAGRHRSGAWIGGGVHRSGERRTLIIFYSSQLCLT